METPPGFIIAGVQSRSGKTTLTLALMAAIKRAGIELTPFKAGPDYLDPAWHQAVCGRPSYNLDTFMIGKEPCRSLFHEKRGKNLGVVEGVMGLYDGKSGVGGPGSTADLARTLQLPVLLVVNARGMAGSLVPLIDGFVGAANGFSIAGVLANQVGSKNHARLLTDLLAERALPPLVGWMPRQQDSILEERHLGLVPPEEQANPPWERLSKVLHLDLTMLLNAVSKTVSAIPPAPDIKTKTGGLLQGKQLAVARDQAFCFLYPANLEWLQEEGATLFYFSPIAGDPLPKICDALWLPGGYPELFAEKLSKSKSWTDIRSFAGQGGSILAECGGMMALGNALTDANGRTWPMGAVLPIHTRMTGKLAGLGYRQERSGVRGHEFHHSTRGASNLPTAFQLNRGDNGVQNQQTRASYIHWYFPSQPKECARWLGG